MSTSNVTQYVKLDFKPFKAAVASQFNRMSKHQLFRTAAEKDQLWGTYLESFPSGTNPIFQERTEHDCNCCRGFIRAVGNVVAIIDGKLESLWDIQLDGPYQVVADALAQLVKSKPIVDIFLHTEPKAGVDKNFQQLMSGVKTWEHFYVNLPRQFVVNGADIGGALSESRSTYDVMLRGLTEITPDAIDTVLELIAQNSLYRGEENKFALTEFRKLKREFSKITLGDGLFEEENKVKDRQSQFVWSRIKDVPASVSRIRNTAIGTLLTDLSTGVDLEDAVKSFEAKVAPANYKRPTALITEKMVQQAQAKIQELGLMSALDRRYATLTDINVNNILFADRSTKKVITGNVFDEVASALPEKVKNLDKVEEVSIEKFVTDILPKAATVEVLFENRHVNNLVSLIAPADPTAGQLFKWPNNFSWSYNGEVADSIKERVKKAGGNVSGDLCCRLAWSNYDDLDFHMVEPNGYEIMYTNKGQRSPSGGTLDVDMNAGSGKTRDPVENIYYADRNRMAEGVYKLYVHQFAQRERDNVGFEVEFDFLGTVHRFSYDKPVKQGERITVVEFHYSHKDGVQIKGSMPFTQATKTVWGLPTQTFHKVNVIMLSPNHWDGNGVGNRHYFFMVDGSVNDGSARGFYNEFLRSELDPHRKSFEIVGSKVRTPESNNQLSGLGFSSTQRNHLVCRVKGSFTRTLKVVF